MQLCRQNPTMLMKLSVKENTCHIDHLYYLIFYPYVRHVTSDVCNGPLLPELKHE